MNSEKSENRDQGTGDRDRRPRGLPRWLKRNVPKGDRNHFTAGLIRQLDLQTVCDHARCPNRMECYSRRTATFMILGDVCTRACRFCSVRKGIAPQAVDPDEPRRVAEAVKTLELKHVVITCVTRDDLADGGAEHFYQTVQAVRGETDARIEVLPSDFAGNFAAIDRVLEAEPDVYNHNVETVPRLFSQVRDPRTNYRRTLEMFRHISRTKPTMPLKTGLMLGLGETTEELLDMLAELHDAGCRMLTLGQYLQPGPLQTPVVRYLTPDEFERLGELARKIGFVETASAPFVRSSYRAGEMINADC